MWNKTRKRDAEGKTAVTARPESEWLRLDRPELRIVSDDAWDAAHARLRGIRARLETAQGSRPGIRRDIDSKYLLSGFARCATCGGTLVGPESGPRRQRGIFLRLPRARETRRDGLRQRARVAR